MAILPKNPENEVENTEKEVDFTEKSHEKDVIGNEEYSSALEVVFDFHLEVAEIYDKLASKNPHFDEKSPNFDEKVIGFVGNPKWKRLAMRKALGSHQVKRTEEAVSALLRVLLDPTADEQAKLTASVRVNQGMSYWQNLVFGRS
jgi:hypothetical protein